MFAQTVHFQRLRLGPKAKALGLCLDQLRHAFERGFVMFACALALISLVSGYRHHHRPVPLLLALPGLALLIFGVTFAEKFGIGVHSVMVTCGGLLVASAHFVNLRTQRALHIHGPQCAH